MSQMKKYFFDPNDYSGSDIERINAAMKDAGISGGTVRIGKRRPAVQNAGGNAIMTLEERDVWVIDSAILIPGNVHFIIDNCTVKLSNRSRDNMIRSANCGLGIDPINPLKNIHITGIGNAVLEGADDPRATGDGAKYLISPDFTPEGLASYGSDAGKANESQKGDWRNIGILMARVDGFSIENLTIRDSHCWAISLEYCTGGRVRDIVFDSNNGKVINGKWELIRNQDGLDLRRGCRDILIENITGKSGDDLIALTALPGAVRPAGTIGSTMISGGDENISDGDISNITISNVRGYCAGGHHIIRLLNNGRIKLHNIQITQLMDTSPQGLQAKAAIKIGDQQYGGSSPLGDTSNIQISGVISKAENAVLLGGSLKDSMISDVLACATENEGVVLQNESVPTDGVFLNNIRNAGKNGIVIQNVSDTFKK